MTSAKVASDAPVATDSDDIFFMTNLSPRMTGLPMSIWVSPRGNARHDVRIKVNMTHGNRMTFDDTGGRRGTACTAGDSRPVGFGGSKSRG